jgi:hypothetical protein
VSQPDHSQLGKLGFSRPDSRVSLPIAKSTFEFDWKNGFGGWSLAGNGKSYHDCGKTLVFGCLDVEAHVQGRLDADVVGKAFLDLRRRSCGRPECPVCYEKWAGKEAHKIEYRLGEWKSKGRVIHVAVSVPKSLYGHSIESLRSRAYRIARSVGFFGGSCVYHPARERCVFCGSLKDSMTKNCENCGCSEFKWVFSPHFHLLGYGWIQGNKVAELYRKEGWIVKNLGIRDTVVGTALYELSHAGVHADHHSVTWFGSLSYNKMRVAPEVVEKKTCPLCGGELSRLLWVGEGEMPFEGEGEFYDCAENWIRWRGGFG